MKNTNLMKIIVAIGMTFTLISCHSNQIEDSHTADKFKKLATDAGVFDRIEFEGVNDFYADINWNEVTDEDWENWKNFVELSRSLIKDEARYAEENEYVQSLIKQYSEESEGKSPDEQTEIYRKYNK